MEITVTYSCPECGFIRTETVKIEEGQKKKLNCKSCEFEDAIVLDASENKQVLYA